MDPDQYRAACLDQWERSAAGWEQQAKRMQQAVAPVSLWMIEAIDPQPGQTVLEVAAGPGETGFLAAELIRPGGWLICSDFAESMLEVARRRAEELGLRNVEFRRLDAESLDLDAASVDAVLCRLGYMLVADPEAAFRETRRVLRPGRPVALAAWSKPEENPWASVGAEVIRRRLGAPQPEPGQPGMFAFGQPGRIEQLLDATGFDDIRVEPLEVRFEYASMSEWWAVTLDCSRPLRDMLDNLEPAEADATRAAVEEQLSEWVTPEGGLSFPARTLVAAATA